MITDVQYFNATGQQMFKPATNNSSAKMARAYSAAAAAAACLEHVHCLEY
jgi:hypothetical protein